MNRREELLAKSQAALDEPAAIQFIQSLKILAPENMPGMAKALAQKAGSNMPWAKAIVDLARLAKLDPEEFSGACGGIDMKTIRRIPLKPEYIQYGYVTIVQIENFECALKVEVKGDEKDVSWDDLLSTKIEKEKTDAYTVSPFFSVALSLPPVSLPDLEKIIDSFGPVGWPNKKVKTIKVDGYQIKVNHDFSKLDEHLNFHYWLHFGRKQSISQIEFASELNDFCMKMFFHVDIEGIRCENYEIPQCLKSREFRLKIVLACLHEYFGLPIKI